MYQHYEEVAVSVERSGTTHFTDAPSVSLVQEVATTSREEGGENEVVLVQTTNQFDTYRKVMVTPVQVDNMVIVSTPTTPTFSVKNEQSTRDESSEYQNLNSTTLKRYYGDATPYGTVARVTHKVDLNEADTAADEKPQSFATFPRRSRQNEKNQTSNLSVQSFGQTCTLRRVKRGFYTTVASTEMNSGSLCYADFLPEKIKETGGCMSTRPMSKSYEKFQNCMDKANIFLEKNPDVELKTCESLIQRLDHDHRADPESTTSHDRSHLIGLRLWYIIKKSREIETNRTSETPIQTQRENDDEAQTTQAATARCGSKLRYMNVVPDFKNKAYRDGPKRKIDHPRFEDIRTTVEKFNNIISKNPIPGRLLKLETIAINYAIALSEEGQIDPDIGYWCLDAQGHWNVIILRVFFVEGETTGGYVIDFKDFAPIATKVAAHNPEFEGMDSLNARASEWMCNEKNKNLIASWPQIVEQPFHMRSFMQHKGKVDTYSSCYTPSKNSAAWNTLRILRLWHARPNSLNASREQSLLVQSCRTPDGSDSGIAVYSFSPCQVILPGCCGIRKPIFATTDDTVTRINAWISNTGADVIAVQTDNVEKWHGKRCQLGRCLENRTYNRQDFKSSRASSTLDYRLTLFRVFVRSDSKGRLPEMKDSDLPACPEPVEPCCCFVGCTVM